MYSQKPADPKAALLGLQYLRGIAALMVAYFHAAGQIAPLTPLIRNELGATAALSAGVDIFFVISGFIMIWTTRSSTPGDFAIRRLIRIVPLYWLLTSITAVLVLWRPDLFHTTLVDLESYLKSMLFVPYANASHGGEVVPLLVPGWSLNLEMFFYAIFAVVLFIPTFDRRLVTNGLVFAALLLAHYSVPVFRDHGPLLFLSSIKLIEFWLGMLVARFYLHGAFAHWRPAHWWLLGTGAFALLVVRTSWWSPPEGDLAAIGFTILPAAAIVLSVVMLERQHALPRVPGLLALGDASYSIYLSHILLLGVARFIWIRAGLETPTMTHALGFVALAAIIVVAGSLLVYNGIERPITKGLQHLYRRTRQVAASPAAQR